MFVFVEAAFIMKRDGREFDNEVPPKKMQKGDVSNISVRFLIPARAAGLIIGKGGENIKRIRNQVTVSSVCRSRNIF